MQKTGSGESLARIEESQAALRVSIDNARQLAAQSERLIAQHRDSRKTQSPR